MQQAHLRTHLPGSKPHSVTTAFRQHRQIPSDPPSLGVACVRQRRGTAPPGTSQQTCSSRCPSGRTTARTRRCEHWSPTGSGRQHTHGRDIVSGTVSCDDLLVELNELIQAQTSFSTRIHRATVKGCRARRSSHMFSLQTRGQEHGWKRVAVKGSQDTNATMPLARDNREQASQLRCKASRFLAFHRGLAKQRRTSFPLMHALATATAHRGLSEGFCLACAQQNRNGLRFDEVLWMGG